MLRVLRVPRVQRLACCLPLQSQCLRLACMCLARPGALYPALAAACWCTSACSAWLLRSGSGGGCKRSPWMAPTLVSAAVEQHGLAAGCCERGCVCAQGPTNGAAATKQPCAPLPQPLPTATAACPCRPLGHPAAVWHALLPDQRPLWLGAGAGLAASHLAAAVVAAGAGRRPAWRGAGVSSACRAACSACTAGTCAAARSQSALQASILRSPPSCRAVHALGLVLLQVLEPAGAAVPSRHHAGPGAPGALRHRYLRAAQAACLPCCSNCCGAAEQAPCHGLHSAAACCAHSHKCVHAPAPAGERLLAVLVGETIDSGPNLHKFVLMPPGEALRVGGCSSSLAGHFGAAPAWPAYPVGPVSLTRWRGLGCVLLLPEKLLCGD